MKYIVFNDTDTGEEWIEVVTHPETIQLTPYYNGPWGRTEVKSGIWINKSSIEELICVLKEIDNNDNSKGND